MSLRTPIWPRSSRKRATRSQRQWKARHSVMRRKEKCQLICPQGTRILNWRSRKHGSTRKIKQPRIRWSANASMDTATPGKQLAAGVTEDGPAVIVIRLPLMRAMRTSTLIKERTSPVTVSTNRSRALVRERQEKSRKWCPRTTGPGRVK